MAIEITKNSKTALLFGATGLVGSYCLRYLLDSANYHKVIAFTRKDNLDVQHDKLEIVKINFDRLEAAAVNIQGNDLFYCIGTTMAKAGDQKTFLKVDYHYPYEIAKIAAKHKVNQFLLVSSVGADPAALFFYSRVKGKLEAAVKPLEFWATHIFRPSVLLGQRNENRWGETIAGFIGKGIDQLTGGMLSRYQPIEAEVVAQAMVNAAQGIQAGVFEYPSHQLQQLADQSTSDSATPNISNE